MADDDDNILVMVDVRKFLREAGVYDSSLTEKEMRELYRALKESKDTASAEDEQRSIFKKTDENCEMIEELQRNSVIVDSEEDPLSISFKESETSKLSTKLDFTESSEAEDTIISPQEDLCGVQENNVLNEVLDVFVCPPTTHKPLPRISITPMYNPPYYCNPKVTHSDRKQHASMVANYHLTLLGIYEEYQLQSIVPAPLGKPIQMSSNFNGSLMKQMEKITSTSRMQLPKEKLKDADSDSEFETYVSRSGRQTKRKLYNESNDDEWTERSIIAPLEQKAKKRNASNLSNNEIMKKSKLFRDNKVVSRTDKMFTQLQEEGRKKKEAEDMVGKFTKTLDFSDDSTEDISDIVHIEEPFSKKRIEPPSGVKPRAGRSRAKKPSIKKTPVKKNNTQQVDKYEALNTMPSTSKKSQAKGKCPMCGDEFFVGELTEHAPGCIDSYANKQQTNTPKLGLGNQIMMCTICDEVFNLDMDYEVHVKSCLNRVTTK